MTRRRPSPAAAYLDNLAPGSRRTQERALEVIARIASGGRYGWRQLRWERLRYADAQAIRAELTQRYQPATATRMLAGFRRVMRAAWQMGLMSHEVFSRTTALPPINAERLQRGRHLTVDDLGKLFDACALDDNIVGVRDAALCAVLYGCGVRVSEASALDTANLDLDGGTLVVLSGKRDKDRRIPLAPFVVRRLETWLAAREGETPALFVALNGGYWTTQRLTADGIRAVLRRRAARAGLGRVTPHDMRRSCAGHLLAHGVDLLTVQRILGHADPKTTARYDLRGLEAAREAVSRLPEIGG